MNDMTPVPDAAPDSEKIGTMTERLLTLTATLLNTRIPISVNELRQRIPGYPRGPDQKDNFNRMFERDKSALREQEIPLDVKRIPGTDPPEEGYIIDPKQYCLKLNLTPGEFAALYFAQLAGASEGKARGRAIRKLGGALPPDSQPNPDSILSGLAVSVPNPPTLLQLLLAKSRRQVAEFSYNNQQRQLLVWRFDYSRGQWFTTGYDLFRQAERTFALDRIPRPVSTRPAVPPETSHVEPPSDFTPGKMAIRVKPWEVASHAPLVAELLVDAGQADIAEQKLGSQAVAERRPDGSVVFKVVVGSQEQFYDLALFFLDEAEILAPPSLRQGFLKRLAGEGSGGGRAPAPGQDSK